MYAVAQAHCVELAGIGAQRGLDVAQAFAPRQLSERHHAKLLGAIHTAYPGVARVAFDNSRKTRPRHKLHDLCEQRLSDIHEHPPPEKQPGETTQIRPFAFQIDTKTNQPPSRTSTGFLPGHKQFNRTLVNTDVFFDHTGSRFGISPIDSST